MDCEAIRMLLTALVRDGLDPTTRNEVYTHLAGCPSCQERLAELEAEVRDDASEEGALASQGPMLESSQDYPLPAPRAKLARMSQRFAMIFGACVLGLAVMVAAIIFGGEGPLTADRRIADPGEVHAPAISDDDVARRSPREALAGTGRGFAEFIGKEGKQLTQLAWQSSERRPLGVHEVAMPGARIHLIPFVRVLQVQAMEGTFNLPDDQVRSGRFRKNVVLTLFDAPPGRSADLSNDSPDIKLRLFLDEADFDLELGIIESNSPVHATSGRFDFRGTGLRLNYNAAMKRIDRLEIPHGQQLRIKSDALTQSDTAPPAAPPEAQTTPSANVPPVTVNGEPAAAPPAPAAAPPAPAGASREDGAKFYRATLNNEVKIVSTDTTITADQLALIFTLTGSDMSDGVFDEPAPQGGASADDSEPSAGGQGAKVAPAPAGSGASARAGESTPEPTPAAQRAMPDPPMPASMLEVSPDDLRVTWRGSLVVQPQEEVPVQLAGTDDVQLLLWGKPVRVESTRGDPFTVLAGNLSYLSGTQVLELFEALHQPVTIDSPQLGVITGQRMVLDQGQGAGVLHGAGELIARGEAGDEAETNLTLDGDRPRLPPGLKVSWQQRVDLDFYRTARKDARTTESGLNLNALRNVRFIGDVVVRHPKLELEAQQLALALTDPLQGDGGAQSVSAIEADDDVRVWARGKRETDDLAIATQHLTIAMQSDGEGKLRPARMIARGDVMAQQPDHKLWTDLLDVELADAGRSSGGDDMLPPVRFMTAQDNVRVEIAERGVAVTGRRLEASVHEDKLDLYGADDKPAQVLTRDGVMTGEHIVMVQREKTVTVDGPGTLAFAIDDSESARAQAPASGPIAFTPDPLKLVHVQWKESMRFDDLAGEAQFFGDVTVNGRNVNDTTHLASDKLFLTFVDAQAPSQPVHEGVMADASGPMMQRMLGGDRAIRTVLADGNAMFLCENWVDQPGSALATRVRMSGPNLAFNQETQHITITGKGNMLVQDERSGGGKSPAEPASKSEAARPTQFSGRGATVFTWRGSMLLDAAQNDMKIADAVRMIHRPLGKTEVVQLDCSRFVADLEATGGLSSWLGKRGPQPALLAITADENVNIIAQGKTVMSDHLLYTGSNETVLLWADRGGAAQIIDETRPAPYSAASFTWDLRHDHFTVTKPGAARVPIR